MATMTELQRHIDRMVPPEYWAEDCHLCGGDGCEECSPEEQEGEAAPQ